jgi:hypothetical protein
MHPQARPSAPSQAPVWPAPPAALVPRLALLHPSPPRNRPQHHRRPRTCPPRGRQTRSRARPTLTSTRQLRAAPSSLTTPIPLGCTNRPTGAARGCFFLLPPRSRQRRRPLLHHLRSSRRLRLTAAPRPCRPDPRRSVNCRSTSVLPRAERGARPGPASFPTARLPKSPVTLSARGTRKSAATNPFWPRRPGHSVDGYDAFDAARPAPLVAAIPAPPSPPAARPVGD